MIMDLDPRPEDFGEMPGDTWPEDEPEPPPTFRNAGDALCEAMDGWCAAIRGDKDMVFLRRRR